MMTADTQRFKATICYEADRGEGRGTQSAEVSAGTRH